MAIQRATTLYPRNDTTVDTGTGIDARLLSDTQSGTNDVTQTVTATHTQDNVERTFDPATAGVSTVMDARTLQKLGWALRLTEDMTPGDDTNCDVVLLAQTVAVQLEASLGWGGTPLQNSNLTFRAALFKYNPSTDTGTYIADGASVSTQWTTLQANQFKTIAINVVVGSNVTFSSGEVLLLQIGVNTTSLGNPVSGTITYTITLRINNVTTKMDLASRLIQFCALSQSIVGEGLTSRNALPIEMSKSLVGEGLSSFTRGALVAQAFNVVGEGLASRQGLDITQPRNVLGEGLVSHSKFSNILRSFDVVGEGLASRNALDLALARAIIGEGLTSSSKVVVVAKTFNVVGEGLSSRGILAIVETKDVIGEGLVSATKVVIAAKTFDVVGEGLVAPGALVLALSRSVVGEGLSSGDKSLIASKTFTVVGEGLVSEAHPVQAYRTFDIVGEGLASRGAYAITQQRDVVGEGLASGTKLLIASKVFTVVGEGLSSRGELILALSRDVVGEGLVTELHPLTASRIFNIVGEGLVTGRIELPIDEVPEGGGGGNTYITPIFVFDD